MLWLQDVNGDQTVISGAFEVALTETLGSFDQLSFQFIVDPNNAQDQSHVAATMMMPRTIVVEPITGKKFRILQSQPESLGDKQLYTITCTSIAYDLHDTYIETKLDNTQSLTACLDLITSGTNFKYHVTGSFANYSFSEGFGGDFADTLLSNLASDFGFEFYFNNYDIYIQPTIGKSGAFIFVENANAAKLNCQEDYSTITTYIKGYGKQNDDGTYACTADYTSPLASTWGKIWASPYSNDLITDQATLLAKLKSQIHDYPDVQYSMSYPDFKNNVQGFTNDTTPGNYGWLRNRFGIDVLVRVQSRTWYPQEQDSAQTGTITFGNKIFDPNYFWQQLKNGYQENKKLKQELSSNQSALEQLQKSYSQQSDSISDLSEQVSDIVSGNSLWTSGSIFIDVSHWQSDTSVAWFTKCANAGAKGVMIKISDGSNTSYSSVVSEQLANSASAGLGLVGCYHYLETPANAAAEAANFLAQLQANSISTDKIVALDIEGDALDTAKADLDDDITTFFNVLINAGYKNTCLYGSKSSFGTKFDGSLAKYTWIAAWGSNKPSSCSAWQYTDDFDDLNVDASKSYDKAFI